MDFLTVTQAAEKLGISRVAVFKKIKCGKLKAERAGNMYLIPVEEFKKLKPKNDFRTVDKAVRMTIREYGKLLEDLSKE